MLKIIITSVLMAIVLVGCGEDSSGTTSNYSTPKVPQITADNGGLVSYNTTGDGSYNQDCRVEGDGDCENNIFIITDANLSGDHFFGDDHTDASTCPFADANIAAAAELDN